VSSSRLEKTLFVHFIYYISIDVKNYLCVILGFEYLRHSKKRVIRIKMAENGQITVYGKGKIDSIIA